MPMRTHELHPALVHAPLVLLPASALVEVLATTHPSWMRRRILDEAGRRLWWGTAASGLLAGLAGMSAAKALSPDDPRVEDAMFVHGIGNVTVVLSAFGLAAWRSSHRASAFTSGLGTGALLATLYTAWIGGELVYAHGLGVKRMGSGADSPPLLSRAGPPRLAKDAIAGLGWLLRRAGQAISRRRRVDMGAAVPGRGEEVSGHLPRTGAPAEPPPALH